MTSKQKDVMTTLVVENLKCTGCEKTVKNILEGIPSIHEITIQSETGTIQMNHVENEKIIAEATEKLSQAGYTPQGESNLISKARSYVSCVKGRMSN